MIQTILYGLTEVSQAVEAGDLGIDGAIVEIGETGPPAVLPSLATEIAASLPPLTARWAALPGSRPLPDGFSGGVTPYGVGRPRRTASHVVCLGHGADQRRKLSTDIDALWIRPRREGTSSATRFDYSWLDELRGRFRLILEIPDGPSGMEAAIRLGKPYAVLLGSAVWLQPGIVDLERVERAVQLVARLNKTLFAS